MKRAAETVRARQVEPKTMRRRILDSPERHAGQNLMPDLVRVRAFDRTQPRRHRMWQAKTAESAGSKCEELIGSITSPLSGAWRRKGPLAVQIDATAQL